jgi:hypothetical protein
VTIEKLLEEVNLDDVMISRPGSIIRVKSEETIRLLTPEVIDELKNIVKALNELKEMQQKVK